MKNKQLNRKKRAQLDAGEEFVNEAEQVKNYFDMKGKIRSEEVEDRFQEDIWHQLSLAEKVGVYAALENMRFDANSTMIRDRLYGFKTEFPGYEELFQKVKAELTAAKAKFLKQ